VKFSGRRRSCNGIARNVRVTALACYALRCVALRCVALRCGAVRCGAGRRGSWLAWREMGFLSPFPFFFLPDDGSFSADAHVAMQNTRIARTWSILLRGRRGYVNWRVNGAVTTTTTTTTTAAAAAAAATRFRFAANHAGACVLRVSSLPRCVLSRLPLA